MLSTINSYFSPREKYILGIGAVLFEINYCDDRAVIIIDIYMLLQWSKNNESIVRCYFAKENEDN